MIKKIVEFSQGEEIGKTECLVMEIPPEEHGAVLYELSEIGAVIEFVDADSIRASVNGGWGIVEKLMSHGWSFNPDYE